MGVNREALARQSETSRSALLGALLALMEEGRQIDISYREIAEVAGVSERTVFRYFANREQLREAVVPLLQARLDHIEPPESLEDLRTYTARLYQICEARRGLVISLLHTDTGRALLEKERSRRLAALRALLERITPPARRAQIPAAAATLRYLISGSGWHHYRFNAGMSPEEAALAGSWAVECVLIALDL